MNTKAHLILQKGEDVTANVQWCAYNPQTKKYDVTYQNGKTYHFHFDSILWLKNPKTVDHQWLSIQHRDREVFDIQGILEFSGANRVYWKVLFQDGREACYLKRELDIQSSCLRHEDMASSLEYLRRIAAVNELQSEDGVRLLAQQYEKLDFLDSESALATYLNPRRYSLENRKEPVLIFPFGGNASQFRAVREAMTNQVSIIQGPPGTGKTQTILNIIANLLVQGKTVLVVSNNNSATANIQEKLESPCYGLGFLAAPLGSMENKTRFLSRQTGLYPDLSAWMSSEENQEKRRWSIRKISQELMEVFARQELLARARQEQEALTVEVRHFQQYCAETGLGGSKNASGRRRSSKKLMRTWQECQRFQELDQPVSLGFKLRNLRITGLREWRSYRINLPRVITVFQAQYYEAKQEELQREIQQLENLLQQGDQTLESLTKKSLDYLRAELYKTYGTRTQRKIFEGEDLWKRPSAFLREYPVILSTTFSSRSSLGKGVLYDYLIMDEASQVDVATGALAMACARNAVIVGDLKQLPNVVTEEIREKTEAIFQRYRLHEGYSFAGNSFLKSVGTILPEAPQTLLREHYRCHPKIIGFCNQKFYHNELLIMTRDKGEKDPLLVYKTVAGDHRRERFNQRQIDVLCAEVLPRLDQDAPENIGIIAPYNDQVQALRQAVNNAKIDVATVHKFQGREKDTIILTPVDDVVTDFSDDPYLLNVAISRAKKRLALVVSGNEQPKDSNIADLIAYIEYHNFEVADSEIYSVFDYLYKQYTQERMDFLKRHRTTSRYDSENLMYGLISDLLRQYRSLSLGVICHQPLNMLIRDPKRLNDEECRYAMNTATHLDFLLYNTITKKPVLAVEVDGFHFHKEGSRQSQRDRMKERILERYGLPLFRFPTTGSGEREKIEAFLQYYAQSQR